jgi:hypothetical protein
VLGRVTAVDGVAPVRVAMYAPTAEPPVSTNVQVALAAAAAANTHESAVVLVTVGVTPVVSPFALVPATKVPIAAKLAAVIVIARSRAALFPSAMVNVLVPVVAAMDVFENPAVTVRGVRIVTAGFVEGKVTPKSGVARAKVTVKTPGAAPALSTKTHVAVEVRPLAKTQVPTRPETATVPPVLVPAAIAPAPAGKIALMAMMRSEVVAPCVMVRVVNPAGATVVAENAAVAAN